MKLERCGVCTGRIEWVILGDNQVGFCRCRSEGWCWSITADEPAVRMRSTECGLASRILSHAVFTN